MSIPNLAVPSGDAATEDKFDIRDHISTLIEGRWWIISFTIAFFVLGLFYAFVAERVYRSDALVQVETEDNGNAAVSGDMAQAFASTLPLNGEIEIIRSRMVLGQVVDSLNLTINSEPHYFPLIGKAFSRTFRPSPKQPFAEGLPGFGKYGWGGERIVVTRLDVADAWKGRRLKVIADGAGGYALAAGEDGVLAKGRVGSMLDVPRLGLKLFVQVLTASKGKEFLVWSSPREAEISKMVQELSVSEKTRGSSMLQLVYTDTDPLKVRQVLQAIVVTYQRQNVERKSAEAQQTLNFLEQKLPEIRRQMESSEDQLNAFRLRAGSVDLTQETQNLLQQAVTLEQARLELEQKRSEALQRFTANHPTLQLLDAEMAQLNQRIAAIANETRRLPQTQQQLLGLMRDAKVNTDLYTSLLNNSQQIQIVRAGTVGNVRIIDAPVLPRAPIRPTVLVVLAGSALAGLLAGIAVLYLRRALTAGVEDPAEVEAAIGVPTYAHIPFAKYQKRLDRAVKAGQAETAILASLHPDDITIEALRSLRTSLQFAQLDAPNNIVMLTGPSPGLGKSFISLNLGAVLTGGGKRTLVIDGDMRRGHLQQYLSLPRTPGLSDVIAGAVTLQEAIRKTAVPNLSVLTTGTVPPNPSELLLNERFARLLQEVSAAFDIVIVDSPPVLAVTDACIIGKLAGTTLLVLKAGAHPMRAIEDTYKRLQVAGVAVRGTLMNQLSERGQGSGAYGYRYGYYKYNYSSKK